MKRLSLSEISPVLQKAKLAALCLSDIEDELEKGEDLILDFSGVTSITEEFAQALFEPIVREHGITRVQEILDVPTIANELQAPILAVLARLQAQGGGAASSGRRPRGGQRPPTPPPPPVPPPPPPPAAGAQLVAPTPPARRYTPTRLSEQLHGQLRSYIEAAYPLKAPILVEARARLMDPASGQRVLSQEPFVETTPRYRTGNRYGALKVPDEVRTLLADLSDATRFPRLNSPPEKPVGLLFDPPYAHQGDALERALADRPRDLIVATGTGSGKTESFLLPILGRLQVEATDRPQSFSKRAVRALVLYPMNALVNDQLARLRLLFGDEAFARRFRDGEKRRPIQFGMYTSRTPYAGERDPKGKDQDRVKPLLERYLESWAALEMDLKKVGKWPAKDLRAFYGKSRQNWAERLQTGPDDRELLTRHEMHLTPPDILVTNYSMLEYMLMRPIERPVFARTKAWLEAHEDNRLILVLDEAHMYRGARGAEVGLLIRRLRARLGIEYQPNKLQVIATSASLGSRPDATEAVKRFAADLTGKPPESFDVITGTREVPTGEEPGESALGAALAEVSLATLHEQLHGEGGLDEVLAPVLKALNLSPGPSLEARLHEALEGTKACRRVVFLTAGHARPLDWLAREVFPGLPRAREAVEVLLTLGAIARKAPDAPGLLPTRVHLFFRGLPAVYACINERCEGRQEAPGEAAPAGKLFLDPRVHCDACGSRVLELSSCRDCGAAFFLAFVAEVDHPRFLWVEASRPSLTRIQLLAEAPRRDDHDLWELEVSLATGECNPQGGGPLRTVFMAQKDDAPTAEFARCPVCDGRAKASIVRDLRTKGEKPFTVLVETQFAEQPAQRAPDPKFPNAGRKVLVFSDGRQKAARLAPALEHAHMRDAFRQLLVLGAREVLESLQRPAELRLLYPAFVHMVQRHHVALTQELVEDPQLMADLRDAEHAGLQELVERGLNAPQSFSEHLYQELTDRHHSLAPLGLTSVIESPSVWTIMGPRRPDLGLSEEEARSLLRAWIRLMLERRAFLPTHVKSGFGLGEEDYEDPDGLDPTKESQWVPKGFAAYLETLGLGADAATTFHRWVRDHAVAASLMQLRGKEYYLNDMRLTLDVSDEGWTACTACARLHRFAVRDLCPDCGGATQPVAGAHRSVLTRFSFYREQVFRAVRGDGLEPFGLFAAEHTAQLSTVDEDEAFARTEEYELRFQDLRTDPEQRDPVVDVLSCTTTMEVGIDIGALTSVALRNVPPQVSNYQQRAGRAGRRGKAVASVLTWAAGGTHDAWFFEDPSRIVTGEVRSPTVYVENEVIARRHARAYAVQRFFHETVPPTATGNLMATLGTVAEFLAGGPCSLDALTQWLGRNRDTLVTELLRWLPARSHWRGEDISLERRRTLATEAVDGLVDEVKKCLPLDRLARQAELSPEERDQLRILLDQKLLETLIGQAVLPRYAFPTDVVAFHVFRGRTRPSDRPEFLHQPQRDLQIALQEYAPGRQLTLDKLRYTSAALYSPYVSSIASVWEQHQNFVSCEGREDGRGGCGYVNVEADPGTRTCPICQGTLVAQPYVRPPGFAPLASERARRDRGGSMPTGGRSTSARLEIPLRAAALETWDVQGEAWGGRLRARHRAGHLVLANKGIDERGFVMCVACGRAEPVEGRGFTGGELQTGGRARKGRPRGHRHPVTGGVCDGSVTPAFFLGHRFHTDLVVLRLCLQAPVVCNTEHPAAQAALTTLAQALVLAASRLLQIEEGELDANWSPVQGAAGQEADVYLYDVLPGGAGFARQIQESLADVLKETRKLLAADACTCERSCYLCLRSYDNQVVHAQLDRHLGRELLAHVLDGTTPEVDVAEQVQRLRPLAHVVELQGHAVDLDHTGAVRVPLRIRPSQGVEAWVAVRHPLVEKDAASAPWLEAAGFAAQVAVVDAHDLRHDLPRVFHDEVEPLLG